MRNSYLKTVCITLACVLYVPLSAADAGQFYVAPGLQWMEFDDHVDYKDDEGGFIGLGYDFTDRWSAELSLFELNPDNALGSEVDIDSYKVDLLYDLNWNIGAVETFVVGGMGNLNTDGGNDTLWDVGVGVKYAFSDRITWRTALRSFNYFDRNFGDNDVGIDTSLIFYLGKSNSATRSNSETPSAPQTTSTPATPTVIDSDRDGVPDNRDNCDDTPLSYAVDGSGCPIPVEEIARVELLVNFDFDKSEVKPQYFSEIEGVADFMEQYPDVVVELEGHTDSVGTEAYNEGLSERRASAVRDVLVDRFDIQGGRVTSRGFGESQPVATNDSSVGRSQNRRVITVIIKTLQNYQPR